MEEHLRIESQNMFELFEKAYVSKDPAYFSQLKKIASGKRQDKETGDISSSVDTLHVMAECYLIILFHKGAGVEKNKDKSVHYYQKNRLWIETKANDNDDPFAQFILGYCYYNGLGLSKDNTSAVKYLTLSAGHGNKFAQSSLAKCYYLGDGVMMNQKKSFELYLQSAEQGFAEAQYGIGYAYYKGWYGLEKNLELAREWISKASGQGYLNAVRLMKELDEASSKDVSQEDLSEDRQNPPSDSILSSSRHPSVDAKRSTFSSQPVKSTASSSSSALPQRESEQDNDQTNDSIVLVSEIPSLEVYHIYLKSFSFYILPLALGAGV